MFEALNDIFFLNQNNGWLVGSANKIYKTTDSGISWVEKSINTVNSEFNFRKIRFKSQLSGFIVGTYSDFNTYESKHTVGYSTDGGNSWNFKFSGLKNEVSDFDIITDSVIISSTLDGMILLSSDDSDSWRFKMQEYSRSITNMNFLNPMLGVASCDSGYLLKITNFGEHLEQKSTGYNSFLTNAYYYNDDFLYATGNPTDFYNYPLGSYFLISTNAGENWQNKIKGISDNLTFLGISVVDSSNIWVCSSNKIIRTTNSGYEWLEPTQIPGFSAQDIFFNDSVIGYAAGSINNQGLVVKTTDAGSNWQNKYFNQDYSIKKLQFTSRDIGYASSEFKIYKTTDAGESWMQSITVSNDYISDFYFVSDSTGYAISGFYQPKIYKTTDAGNNWNVVFILNNTVRKVYFLSVNLGFAVGESYLYKTTNGGLSWNQSFVNFWSSINDVIFVDVNNGWICTNNGIKSTTNGGTTWVDEFSTTNYVFTDLLTLDFKSMAGMWAAGSRSIIIKYGAEIIITDIQENEINSNIPTEYKLHQNYPNPFNPVTIIQIDLPEREKVILKIYDILGKEVATLKDEVINPGSYTINWDASKFSSGVYFSQLKVGDYLETKKMILVR